MPATTEAFSSSIAEVCHEIGLSSELILVRDAIDLKSALTKTPAGAKGKTVFAVTPEDDPFLRGSFIGAGWRHRGTEAGDVFWRAF